MKADLKKMVKYYSNKSVVNLSYLMNILYPYAIAVLR